MIWNRVQSARYSSFTRHPFIIYQVHVYTVSVPLKPTIFPVSRFRSAGLPSPREEPEDEGREWEGGKMEDAREQ